MAETIFPFVPGRMVETHIGRMPIDKACVTHVTNQNGVHVMKVTSQGYRPGDSSVYALPSGADPLGDNWSQIVMDPIAEIHRRVCAYTFRFALM